MLLEPSPGTGACGDGRVRASLGYSARLCLPPPKKNNIKIAGVWLSQDTVQRPRAVSEYLKRDAFPLLRVCMVVGGHGGDIIARPPAILAPASCQTHAAQMFHPRDICQERRSRRLLQTEKSSARLGADLAPDPQRPCASAFDSGTEHRLYTRCGPRDQAKVPVSACEGQTEGEQGDSGWGEFSSRAKAGGVHHPHLTSCICWTSFPVTYQGTQYRTSLVPYVEQAPVLLESSAMCGSLGFGPAPIRRETVSADACTVGVAISEA